jgi:hypothetical protein
MTDSIVFAALFAAMLSFAFTQQALADASPSRAHRVVTRPALPPASLAIVSNSNGALPPCSLDSFVSAAGGQAEAIYGDEGVSSKPPYFGFDYSHRINNGINGQRDQGLTTGHGSYMPSAWGADEFLARPGEKSQSGANGGNLNLNHADAALNTADQSEALDPNGIDTSQQNLPPSPGPGYQPIYQHGVFVGYMDPNLIAQMQTNQAAAWAQFANSSEWVGPEGLRLSLLYEVGAATPDQQAQLMQMALGF